MAGQEQKERYQVSITKDEQNLPDGVTVQINWDNKAQFLNKKRDYQETRRFPSLKALVSQVSREKILGYCDVTGGLFMQLSGSTLMVAPVIATMFGANFGELDAPIKIGAFLFGISGTRGGVIATGKGVIQSETASAILRQIQRTESYSIVSAPPQP